MGMKNDFKIINNIVEIYVDSPKHGIHKFLVDLEDFYKINGHTWRVKLDNNKFYVAAHIKTELGYKYGLLHRMITDCPKGKVIDHINGNTLDNRKSNLRICTNSENLQNLLTPAKNNTSGILNATWNESRKKWRVALRVNGKTINIGTYKYKSTAKKAAKEARLKYKPFSQDALKSSKKVVA